MSYMTIILGIALAGVFGANDWFWAIIIIGIMSWLIEAATAQPQR